MTQAPPLPTPLPPPSDLEVWLRSPLRRRVLIAVAVLLLTAASGLAWGEALGSFGRPVDWPDVFGRRLIDWSLWGLALEPIVWLSAALARLVRPALARALLHVPLSVAVAVGLGQADSLLTRALLPFPERPERSERFERGGPAEGAPERPERAERPEGAQGAQGPDGPRRPSRGRSAWTLYRRGRLEFDVLLYWAILGLGWGARTFLGQRDQERHAAGLELRAARLETELTGARLARLESQLHPHFLFNALHSVGGLVRAGEERAALQTLAALGGLLRSMLEHGGEQEVPLAEELELIERYLDIERIRFGERLDARVDVEPGLGRLRVPVLVLLPLVENAVQHGIAPRPEGGRVEVRARGAPDELVLEVADDGPGFPAAVLDGADAGDGHPHIGLANTRERLAALYGERARLELSNPPDGGALVRLRVPRQPEAGRG